MHLVPHPQPVQTHPRTSPRRLWRRIVAAQESGLVLVIALVMVALTFIGGDKSKNVRIDIPAAAEVSRTPDFIVVKMPDQTSRYARDSGWSIDRSQGGPRPARTVEIAEVVERVPVSADAVINDTDGRLSVTRNGETTTYRAEEGWTLQTTEEAKEVVREERATKLITSDVLPGGDVATRAGQIVLTAPGETTWYPERVPWRIVEESETDRYLIGSTVANRFFEKENLVLLTTKASYFAVIAVGMTAIIVLAGIDLSVGSIYAVAAVVGAMVLTSLGSAASVWIAVPVGLVVCCAVGALLGMANGAMIVGLRLHPFIITLGTMAIYRGLVLLFTGGETVSGLPESIQRGFFKAEFSGVYPTLTIIMIVVALIGTFVLQKTVLGRRIYAIGGNETAAYYAGIPVGRVKLIVYTLGGLLAGLSACMEVGYNATASVGAGQGYELNVIAAAVIGGASLSGGRGSAIGAVLGAILVSLIDNAMVILDINQNYNQIVMGGAIVIAVAVDQLKRRYLRN